MFAVKSPTSDLTWHKGAKRIMANLERYANRALGSKYSPVAYIAFSITLDTVGERTSLFI